MSLSRSPYLLIPRRRFLGGLAGAALLGRGIGADDSKSVTISILHTTDLHGHIVPTKTYEGEPDVGGLARCATQIRKWQKENPNFILLDIGDVYQGTHVSRATGGQLMIDLFNRLQYDAWVIGNHEFDWGLETLTRAITASKPAVLASNAMAGGRWTNTLQDKSNPLSKVQPYLIKDVAGFRIGIIGSVTPGLPSWLHPSLLKDFSAGDPLRSVQFAIRRLQSENVDAIVLAAHFGLKGVDGEKGRPDDFANRIHQVTAGCRELNVVIAGHTHRDIPDFAVNDIPYTQGNYYGIDAGRVDLTFDRESRKLVSVKVGTVRMDKSVEQDAMVLSAAAKDLEASDKALQTVAGELMDTLSCKSPSPGVPSPSLLLITRAIRHALTKRGTAIDGVLHGLFMDDKDVTPGKKTIADVWEIIPYENRLATVELSGAELSRVMEEVLRAPFTSHGLDGMSVKTEGERRDTKVTAINLPGGQPVDPAKRYRIALNGFDAQSGGQRYKLLADLVRGPEAKLTLYDVESRDAVLEFLTEKKTVRMADLAG